jgi:hypothetical protein
MTVAPDIIRPGHFAVVNTGTSVEWKIRAAEFASSLAEGKAHVSEWDHAVICSAVLPGGKIMIVEAEPGGASEVPWHYEDRPHLWSYGIPLRGVPVQVASAAARRYVGTPYSYADYAALALHDMHVPFPGLKNYIADSGHMICSQLVDQVCQDIGVHLFDDGRWPGYVQPWQLGVLLKA